MNQYMFNVIAYESLWGACSILQTPFYLIWLLAIPYLFAVLVVYKHNGKRGLLRRSKSSITRYSTEWGGVTKQWHPFRYAHFAKIIKAQLNITLIRM